MSLNEQILTIFASLIYGFLFYCVIRINRKVLFQKNVIKKIIASLLFSLDATLLYFIMIKKINNGTLNFYSYVLIVIGMILAKKLLTARKK